MALLLKTDFRLADVTIFSFTWEPANCRAENNPDTFLPASIKHFSAFKIRRFSVVMIYFPEAMIL